MDLVGLWSQFKGVFIELVKYGFPTVAIILSILSYMDSRKANKFRGRLSEIEEKLKKYELEDKEKERQEANNACVEARIMHVARHSYKMKVWNSGQAIAYNVDFDIPPEYKGMIRRDKVPYEFLEPGKNFEEHVMVHSGTPNKLIITIKWEDERATVHTKEQILTV